MKTPKKQPFFTIPRIIAVAIIVIGLLLRLDTTNFTNMAELWTGFIILGAILLLAPTNYTIKLYDKWLTSFKQWKTALITALYDAAYWILVFGGLFVVQSYLNTKSAAAQHAGLMSREALADPGTAAAATAAVQDLFGVFLASMAALLALTIIIYSLSRAFIWTTITNKKLNKKFILKFTGLNAIYWVIWMIPLVFIFIAAAQSTQQQFISQSGMFLISLLFMYFAPIVHTTYMKTNSIGKSLSTGFGWGVGKIVHFVVPYAFIFLTMLIILKPAQYIIGLTFANFLSLILSVVFIAWMRLYLYSIIKDIK